MAEIESRPEKTYIQRIPALQRCVTKFSWLLPDWSLLYDMIYSKGFKSDSFQLEGVDRCNCQLHLDLTNESHGIEVSFSDPASILAVQITIRIDEQKPAPYCISQPVPNNYRLPINIPKEKKEIQDVLNVESSKETNDAVTISADFVVVKIPHPSFCKVLAGQKIWEIPAEDILFKLRNYFEKGDLCDVTFEVDGVELAAPKNFLAAHSEVFRKMFYGTANGRKLSRVPITNTSEDVFDEFLDYMYTGEVYLHDETVEEMITVADRYKVTELKGLCENYMSEYLDAETVVMYLIIADKLGCVNLKNKALEFIKTTSGVFEKVVQEGNREVMMSLKKILDDSSTE